MTTSKGQMTTPHGPATNPSDPANAGGGPNGAEVAAAGRRRPPAKAVLLVAVLVLLWGYAAVLTGRDTLDLLRVRTLSTALGQPADMLILSLQLERRLTAATLAGQPGLPATLTEQRADTDAAVNRLRRFDAAGDPWLTGTGEVRDRAAELIQRLDALGPLRESVDAGRVDREQTATAYTEMIDAGFAVYGGQWTGRETDLIEQTRAFVALARARELLAREDALLTGALAAGRLTAADRSRLTDLVAAQRFVRAEAAAGLPAADRARYRQLVGGGGLTALRALEDLLAVPPGVDEVPPVPPQTWRAAVDPVLADLRDLVTSGIRGSVDRSTPATVGVVVRTGVVGGLGFLAVLAVLIGVLGGSRRSERRPVPPPAPDAPPGPDQELVLRLTRRTQVLLRRQLTLLDELERRETDAEELAELFRIDHLATRIRRDVENLLTAAGAVPARRWRRPVPLVDVVRGAAGEVEDYRRVLVSPGWVGSLAGPAVLDLTHLLAELIENGLDNSPAESTVRVNAQFRDGGCLIVVLDDGQGLTADALADTNALLRDPPPVRPPGAGHGLYSVARRARRWNVRVELRPSPRGGTAAWLRIPSTLLVGPASTAPPRPAKTGPGGVGPDGTGPGATGPGGVGPGGVGPGATGPGGGPGDRATVELPAVAALPGRHPTDEATGGGRVGAPTRTAPPHRPDRE
nr:nitrate- and nitrite sensing domain-containing protein [Micromonospora sp. DSM 115978]